MRDRGDDAQMDSPDDLAQPAHERDPKLGEEPAGIADVDYTDALMMIAQT